MNTQAVGRNIRRRLTDIGMSQHDLAKKVGLTEVTISRYVTGQRQPTAYALYRMARVLGVTMEQLMQGVE